MARTTITILAVFLAAAAALAAAGLRVKVTAEVANIRQKPSIGSPIVRQFPQGEVLEAVRQEGEWFLVKFEADETGATGGYVHESLVMALDDIPKQDPVTRIEQPQVKREPPVTPVETKPVAPPAKAEPAVVPPVSETASAEGGSAGLPGRASLSFYGGGSLIAGGELNTAAQGLADYYASGLGVAGDMKIAAAKLGLTFGLELGLPLGSQLQLVVGGAFHKAEKSSLVTYALGTATNTFNATPGFQAVPLRAGLAYYPMPSFYVKFGAAFYIAKATYDYRYAHDKYEQEWQGEATAQGFGFWGGLGVDWSLAETLSLFVEATGEYAPITGFSGTGTYNESTSSSTVTETGKLYAFNSRTSSQTSFPVAFIRSKAPAEAGVENVREATVDFSGISVRLGLKIKF